MRKFFIGQCMVVFALLYIQMAVQEGHFDVFRETLGSFAILLASAILLSMILVGIRRFFNRTIDLRPAVMRTSIYIFSIYYIMQLLGWLSKQGYVGGGG